MQRVSNSFYAETFLSSSVDVTIPLFGQHFGGDILRVKFNRQIMMVHKKRMKTTNWPFDLLSMLLQISFIVVVVVERYMNLVALTTCSNHSRAIDTRKSLAKAN